MLKSTLVAMACADLEEDVRAVYNIVADAYDKDCAEQVMKKIFARGMMTKEEAEELSVKETSSWDDEIVEQVDKLVDLLAKKGGLK